ncbi:MAG TPA: hypothetical protein VN930_07100 [Xanthobacteraceae bacterium]|nr:hypothetical protein [Xanthobacteraceae bacterium]
MRKRLVIALVCAPALAGCSSDTFTGLDWWKRAEIEGNSTGGVIPAQLVRGDVQAAADRWCDKYGRVAKITFNSGQQDASVVFVCVDKGAAAPPPPPPETPPPAAKQPAGPPKKR